MTLGNQIAAFYKIVGLYHIKWDGTTLTAYTEDGESICLSDIVGNTEERLQFQELRSFLQNNNITPFEDELDTQYYKVNKRRS